MSSILLGSKGNRSMWAAAASELAAKVLSLVPDATFQSDGEAMTSAQFEAKLQAYVTAVQTTNSVRAQLHDAIVAEDNLLAAIKAATHGFFSYVIAQYGEASTTFSALGFTVKKLAKKTAAVTAAAVEKSLATRAERHTLGKRQKASIHGTAATPPASTATPPAPTADKPGPTKA
jgi:hypothetical protein